MSEFFNCPTCGQRLRVIGLGGGQHLGGGWQGLAEFDFAPPGAGALPAGAEFVRETPLAQPTIEGSVLVPALQSLLCGLAAGVLTAFPTAAWHWPWWSPLAAGGGVFALSWTVILADSRKLLRKVETWIGADLDGDGEIGPPTKASVSVTIEEAKQHVTANKSEPVKVQLKSSFRDIFYIIVPYQPGVVRKSHSVSKPVTFAKLL